MKIALLFPPETRLAGPSLALPALTAFMRERGHTVAQRDLNIEAYDNLLTAEHLLRAEPILDRKLADIKSIQVHRRWEHLTQAKMLIPYVAENIQEAKFVLRDEVAFYDFPRYLWATRVIAHAQRIIHCEFEPYIFPLMGVSAGLFDTWTVAELLRAARDPKHNPFLPYLRHKAIPSILAEEPELIGISITYHTQIFHGLALAQWLKAVQSDLPIYLGGAIVSEMADILRISRSLFEVVDGFVVGEGESALLGLVEAHAGNAARAEVPNLIYVTQDGEVHCNKLGGMEDLQALPTPDYAGLPLDKYLSPRRLGYLAASRGCYWNRCAFCTSPNALGRSHYRQRSVEQVAKDMLQLRAQHGMDLFFFCDDCFAPRRMVRLAERLAQTDVSIEWVAETRLDQQLTLEMCEQLARGGCKHLIFGLESASQRVLDLMEKGIHIKVGRKVLHNCYQAGIGTVLMTFVNFPTETPQEAQTTVDFLKKVSPIVSFATLGRFTLMKGSLVDLYPERYGIQTVHRSPPDKLAYVYDYELQDGTTPRDIEPVFQAAYSELTQAYPITDLLFHHIHFFLHTTHHGSINLSHLYPPKRTISSLLNLAPRLSNSLIQRHFFKADVSTHLIFDHGSAMLWQITARESELLAACDGDTTVREILTRLLGQATGVEGIKQWFSDLQRVKNLWEKGVFDDDHEDRVVVSPHGRPLSTLSEPASTNGLSEASRLPCHSA